MKGKGWLGLSLAVVALATWQALGRVRRSEDPSTSEVELSVPSPSLTASRTDVAPHDSSLAAAPTAQRGEARSAVNLTATSGLTGRIHGHARDQDGRPLDGYPVWMIEKRKKELFPASVLSISGWEGSHVLGTTVTGTDGAYEIRPVGPGDWLVGIVRSPEQGSGAAEKDFYAIAQLVRSRPGNLDQEVDLVGYRGISIDGIVVTPEGEPVKDATVEAMCEEDGPFLLKVGTDEDGRFSLGALPPERFFLRASQTDVFLPSDTASVTAGTKNVRLELVHGGHLVVSTVHEDSGEPLLASLMSVRREGRVDGGPDSHGPATGLEESTTFDVKGLEAGVYDLIARTREGGIGIARALSVAADGQAHEVVIRIGSSASLVLACEQCRTKLVVEVFSGNALVGSAYLVPRRAKSLLVPPGPIRIHLESTDGEGWPTSGPEADYWTRKGVRSLDVEAVLGEERTIELGGY